MVNLLYLKDNNNIIIVGRQIAVLNEDNYVLIMKCSIGNHNLYVVIQLAIPRSLNG